jgi:hypothetical protein
MEAQLNDQAKPLEMKDFAREEYSNMFGDCKIQTIYFPIIKTDSMFCTSLNSFNMKTVTDDSRK